MCEFSWLPNSILKDIPLPKIIFEEPNGQYYSGYWTEDCICVVTYEEGFQGTIAHEFMHHLQYIQGRKIDNTFHFGHLSYEQMSYEEQIKKYFRVNPNEYEALLFEVKLAKSDNTDWWLRKLVWEN